MIENRQIFNNGICDVYKFKSNTLIIPHINGLRFEYKTVGSERFYKAAEQNRRIEDVIRIPAVNGVEANMIVIINEKQYTIVQAQRIKDSKPPCWQLSLEERKKRLEIAVGD